MVNMIRFLSGGLLAIVRLDYRFGLLLKGAAEFGGTEESEEGGEGDENGHGWYFVCGSEFLKRSPLLMLLPCQLYWEICKSLFDSKKIK